MLDLSVIMPCFNRSDAIERSLLALARQTLSPARFEVILVDDGSTDGSFSIAQQLKVPYSLRLFQQKNGGAGAARNFGAQQAKTRSLVFLDVDMIAAPDLLEQYLAAHSVCKHALIIGRQQPWPSAYQTLFDQVTLYEWFRDFGPERFQPDFYHVLSSSMSIEAAQFDRLHGFNILVGVGTQPATDDTDLGYRAKKSGVDLIYWPKALAYHNHPRSFELRCKQEYTTAFWTAQMFLRYPEMRYLIPTFHDINPIDWQRDRPGLLIEKLKRRLTAWRLSLWLLKCITRILEHSFPGSAFLRSSYWAVLGAYRYQGFREGSA